MKLYLFILSILIFTACNDNTNGDLPNTIQTTSLELKYAKGFSVTDYGNYKVLKILKPWPNATTAYNYIISSKEELSKMTFPAGQFDAYITDSINKIVVTSTTHIPALEMLKVEETLKGFPGTSFISSKNTRQLIEKGKIRDLGKNESINTEVLLELNPDLVVGFGVDGVNKTFEKVKKAGIPVVYNGDWVESSALAKAEWIKFFGTLYNKEKEADSIFNTIEYNYLEAKKLANQVTNRPSVLSGAMHKDVWYLPNGSSPEAQFLKDVNANYLWSDTSGNGSLALSFEVVLEKAKNADIWISPSYYTTLEQLKNASNLYSEFTAFQNKNIFSFTNATGATGGVLYYELGTARPDLVLKDLIKICHPELLQEYQTHFFNRLN